MNLRLGAYDSTLPPKITPLGIVYHEYGLSDYGGKRVRKTCTRMTEAGVEPYIIAQFREWALRLPVELPAWIDGAYERRMAAWRACVGKRLPNGRTISADILDRVTPASFRVILHPEPFAVPQGITAGFSYSDRVEAVGAYLGSYEGVPNSWLRKCDDLIEYELGNLIGIRHGFAPQRIEDEIGSKSPC
jgi:hypothetical protein